MSKGAVDQIAALRIARAARNATKAKAPAAAVTKKATTMKKAKKSAQKASNARYEKRYKAMPPAKKKKMHEDALAESKKLYEAHKSAERLNLSGKNLELKNFLDSSGQTGRSQDELVGEFGWEPHTARAAITRLKAAGVTVRTAKVDDVTRYISVPEAK